MAQPMLNLGGDLSPEQQIRQQQIARQQKMAELLMQQGQQTPQGQIVGNRFVAPSFFQYAAPLLQGYVGRKELEKVEGEQLKLAKELREQGVQETQRLMNLIGGRTATPEQVTEMAGPYTDNVPMPTAYMAAQPAIEVNPRLAYAEALNMQSPQARALLPQIAIEAFKKPEAFTLPEGSIRFQTMPDGTVRQVATGGEKPRAPLQIDTGTAIELRDPANPTVVLQRIPKSLSPADAARMQFEGITGGGMPMGNAPTGGVPTANLQPAKDKFAPAIQPQYQYNPAISPKLNQEAAAKFAETLTKNETNAKDSFDLMKAASKLLSSEAPSSGRLSNIVTGTREFFGGGGETSKADAQLNLLSGALTMKQPRFEGPQGVLDVTLYQKLAGDLGNPNLPIPSRLATINQMIDLQKKYYPEGDWDSISTKTQGEAKTEAVKSAGKVSLSAPQYATNPTTGARIVSTDGGINWKPAGNK